MESFYEKKMQLELTEIEVSLLRDILACLTNRVDWVENDNNWLVKSTVLLDKNKYVNQSEMVNKIFNNLFPSDNELKK